MIRTIRLRTLTLVVFVMAMLLHVGTAEGLSLSQSAKGMPWVVSTLSENILPNRAMTPPSYDFKRLEAYQSEQLSEVFSRWNRYNEGRGFFGNIVNLSIKLDEAYLTDIEKTYGAAARERIERWQTMTTLNDKLHIERKLSLVNEFFNKTDFKSDMSHWGQEDYWASPVELLSTNAGDCEDYSIAKYFTLMAMGVPVEHLRITYVKAVRLNQAHMVLAYYEEPNKEPLILDNMTDEILPASERTDLVPVYSFNG
ncbi:transglutaminase-like cysteine peptidase [Alkalimarinus sediminis]|uniref:Transglutaminase-like cysteine peptidase n=1 Tax=Alkalimarinus sediminis TaxID=1632866 RepID=A0A9E8KQU5_9ALTE|nr:transglutaminase-like cysteine peptidase [Alkalimarinus sediminis]UZW75217.1 transglutaminase-like cysteine peptidase [Alkalimarinus sediminis]